MIEKINAISTQPDQEPIEPESFVPVKWTDLLVYLFGGIGLYLLASAAIGLLYPQINLITAMMVSVANFIVLSGSLYLFGVRRKKLSWESIGLLPPRNLGRQALIGAALALAIMPLRLIAGGIGLLIEQAFTGEIASLAMRESLFTVGMDTWYGVLLMVLGIGVLAPVGEELFFRGLLFDFFKKKTGITWGIGLSSLAFGLAHFDSLAVVFSSMLMGVAMAIAVQRTGSIWISIFMHVVTNTGAVLLMASMLFLENYFQIPLT